MIELIVFIISILIMFIPTFIAYNRRHQHRFALFWVNLLLGWFVIPWFAVLIWSIWGKKEVGS